MRILHGSRGLGDRPEGPFAAAIGIFDGVHRGHQVLLGKACELARSRGVESLAYTFHPHPAQVLAPELAPRLLEPLDVRLQRLAGVGLDAVLVETFDRAFAATSPQAFIEDILVRRLQVTDVVVGEGFTFGQRQGGNVTTLQEAGARLGFAVHPVPPVKRDGLVISSTKIRELVTAGQMHGAALLLGRPYALVGTVIRGEGRGATIGIPTANLQPHTELVPGNGVYAAVAEGPFGRRQAVVNIGVTPTFGGSRLKIEAHVLELQSGPLYGVTLGLELVARLRDEQRFPGVEELKAQIARDIAAARDLLTAEVLAPPPPPDAGGGPR